MNLLNYVKRVCTTNYQTTSFSCWQCTNKYQHNEDRVQHFIASYFALFSSADNVLQAYLKSRSVTTMNRFSGLKILSTKLKKSFKCWKCDKQLKSQNGRLYHFIQKHARTILSMNIDPSNSLKRQIETLEEQMTTTSKDTFVSTTAMHSPTNELMIQPFYQIETKQNQTTIGEFTYTRSGKSIVCSQRNKEFRSTGIFKKHVNAKHRTTMSTKITSKTKSHSDEATLLQEKLRSASQYPANSIHHSTRNHIESALSFECSSCTQIFESTTDRDNHFKTKHILSEPHTSVTAPDNVKNMKNLSDPIQTYICWQCSKNFESPAIRLDHFLRKHAVLFRSKIMELINNVNNHTGVVQKLSNNAQSSIPSTKRLLRCWLCIKKKFQSERRFLSHFASKHSSLILSTDTDPSSYLEKQLTLADEHTNSVQNETISKTTSGTIETQRSVEKQIQVNEEQTEIEESSDRFHCEAKAQSTTNQESDLIAMNSNYVLTMFSCWRCSKKFKTVQSRGAHYIGQHIASTLPLSNLLPIPVSSIVFTKQYKCWSCTKRFQLSQGLINHFIDKHANFILFATTDPIDILQNEISKAKQQIETSCTHDVAYIKSSAPVTALTTECTIDEKIVPIQVIESINSQNNKSSHPQMLELTTYPDLGFQEKQVESNLSMNVETSNTPNNQSKITMKDENSTDSRELRRTLINISYYCQWCDKAFMCAADHLEHFQANHTGTKSSDRTLEDFFANSANPHD